MERVQRKFTKLRLQPIHVFCFHQVCADFDPSTMYECDWTEIEQFKRYVLKLKEEYTFISLPEAYEKLREEIFRRKKFAVLTSDDGWASLKEILPWLVEQHIPVTLFLNPAYMDGKHFREHDTEKYLNWNDVRLAVSMSNGLLTIGMHGWEHVSTIELDKEAFEQSVDKSLEALSGECGYIPFFAFPWGYGNAENLDVLRERNVIPVYCNGQSNYTYKSGISRDLLDAGYCLK